MTMNDAANGIKKKFELTAVNGIGLWNSWTRNFRTPLLALFDLIDNAIDAPLQGGGDESTIFPGKIHIQPDFSSKFIMERHNVTGFYMINNSSGRVKDIHKILQVYASSKGKFADSIGENGVGLKQGCATLSDLSIVLTRNYNEYCLGFVAAKLQREEGVYLPSFKFEATPSPSEGDDIRSLKPEMIRIFKQTHLEVGDCVKRYGNGDIDTGIERLLNHFELMSSLSPWSEEDYVFSVILHELKHGSRNIEDKSGKSAKGGSIDGTEIIKRKKIFSERTFGLLDELATELPRHYIHIPHSFEVIVNSTKISFYYWQQRLVELSEFYLKIDKKNLYLTAPDWQKPDECDLIRIFCGFDPFRLGQSTLKSTGCLYMYSRQSGRLIKEEEDARAILSLNNSGTQFCQGLTIIVDDMQGYLPLNPTKQDIAFGEESHGENHKKNLFAWIGGYAHFFYNHNLGKCGTTRPKSTLYNRIQTFSTLVDPRQLKTLDQGKFTSFNFENTSFFKTATLNIRVKERKKVEETTGKHTVKRIAITESSPIKKARSPRSKIKREEDLDGKNGADIMEKPTPRKKRKSTNETSLTTEKSSAKKAKAVKSKGYSSDSTETQDESVPISSLAKNTKSNKKIVELKESLKKANEKLDIETKLREKVEERRAKLEAKVESKRVQLEKLKGALAKTQQEYLARTKERDMYAKRVEEHKRWEEETSKQMTDQSAQLEELTKCIEEMDAAEHNKKNQNQTNMQSRIDMLEEKVKDQANIIHQLREQLALGMNQIKKEEVVEAD